MLKKIGLAVLVVIIIGAIVIASRPAAFHIERTAHIDAPPSAVYPLITNFHMWALWSPFDKSDPLMEETYTGPQSGPRAMYSWSGNGQSGSGKMTMGECQPNKLVKIDLEFTKPMESRNTASFTISPQGSGSKVTWAMDGNNNFIGKAFSLVMNMDKMIGPDFAKGLANLNTVAKSFNGMAIRPYTRK